MRLATDWFSQSECITVVVKFVVSLVLIKVSDMMVDGDNNCYEETASI